MLLVSSNFGQAKACLKTFRLVQRHARVIACLILISLTLSRNCVNGALNYREVKTFMRLTVDVLYLITIYHHKKRDMDYV